jgi:hypothetical protein
MNDTPAFPQERTLPCGSLQECEGMMLRDYFAAKIMQSYMMNEIWRDDIYALAAKTAYQVADEMMKAREQ